MSYYAIASFNSKEEAEAFSLAQKDVQVEVVPKEIHDYKHMYADAELVINEYMDLTKEQKEQINVGQIVERLFDYDYSDYNNHIESLINEQLEEEI